MQSTVDSIIFFTKKERQASDRAGDRALKQTFEYIEKFMAIFLTQHEAC